MALGRSITRVWPGPLKTLTDKDITLRYQRKGRGREGGGVINRFQYSILEKCFISLQVSHSSPS